MNLTADWRSWVQDNLKRGCAPDTLLVAMKKSGFSEAQALAAIQEVTDSFTSEKHTNQAYVYEKSRIAQGARIECHDRVVRVRQRIDHPSVVLFDDVLSPSECDELVRLSKLKLKRSAIVDPVTGAEVVIDARSSAGTYFDLCEDEFISRLDRRIADLMHWPIENGEGFQILNYQIGGEYRAHFDYFPPSELGSHLHLMRGGQRVSTLVMYLNDVEEGGETTFPSVGISVIPQKGSALYFEYTNSLGQVDPLSLHAGMPVIRGEKWIATKWMREQPYRLALT